METCYQAAETNDNTYTFHTLALVNKEIKEQMMAPITTQFCLYFVQKTSYASDSPDARHSTPSCCCYLDFCDLVPPRKNDYHCTGRPTAQLKVNKCHCPWVSVWGNMIMGVKNGPICT